MRWNLLKNVHGFWSWMAMPLGNSLQFCWKFHAFPMQFFCSHNSKIWSFHIGSNFSFIHLIYFKIFPLNEWPISFFFSSSPCTFVLQMMCSFGEAFHGNFHFPYHFSLTFHPQLSLLKPTSWIDFLMSFTCLFLFSWSASCLCVDQTYFLLFFCTLWAFL